MEQITSQDDDLGPDSDEEVKAEAPKTPPPVVKSESDASKSSEQQPKKPIPISEKIDKFAQKIKEVQEREREEEERERREKGTVLIRNFIENVTKIAYSIGTALFTAVKNT